MRNVHYLITETGRQIESNLENARRSFGFGCCFMTFGFVWLFLSSFIDGYDEARLRGIGFIAGGIMWLLALVYMVIWMVKGAPGGYPTPAAPRRDRRQLANSGDAFRVTGGVSCLIAAMMLLVGPFFDSPTAWWVTTVIFTVAGMVSIVFAAREYARSHQQQF